MAFITKIAPQDADGLLDRVFKARTKAGARLWEIVAVQSLNAATLRDSMRLYGQLMFGESPLSRVDREMIAVVTSLENECHYWIKAHLHDLRAEANDQDMVTRFARDWRDAGLGEPVVALLEYCVLLTHTPTRCSRESVENLRDHGWSDVAISDAVQVCSYFNYINRIAEGLGVDDESWLDELGMPRAPADETARGE